MKKNEKKQRVYVAPKLDVLGQVVDLTTMPGGGAPTTKQSNQSDGTGVPATKASAVADDGI